LPIQISSQEKRSPGYPGRFNVVIYIVEDWLKELEHEPPKLEIAAKAWFRLDELMEGLTSCTRYGIRQFDPELG
jgi:hypothetical protein